MMTREEALRLFDYDASTGELRWRAGRRAGRVAGSKNKLGYVALKGSYGHRIIWLMVYGEWPSEIDHANGQPDDNRLTNLRLATRSQNNTNRPMPPSKSGFRGVYKDSRNPDNPWVAKVVKNRKQYHVGTFPTPELAYAAYCKAADSLHGEFARFV